MPHVPLRGLALALAASTALCPPAQAQEAAQGEALKEIVVFYGAFTAAAKDRTATTVSVLDAEEIEKTGETRLIEVLARQPGVGILARGPLGTQSGLSIRGLSQNYIKVLVDGIDVSDPSTPQVAYDFGRLTGQDFSRAELIRGSHSAVLGSSAVGGAVVLDSFRPEKEGVSQVFRLEGGSYSTLAGAYSYGVKHGEDEFALTLSKVYTSGFSAADEANGNTEDDGYKATRLAINGQKALGGVTLGFAGFAQYDVTEIDSAFGGPADAFETGTHREQGARVFARFATGAVDHELSASWFKGYRLYTSAFGPYDYTGQRRMLAWRANTALGSGRLSFGLERVLEDYEGTYVTGTVKTARTGAYAEYTFAPVTGLDVVASLRRDENSTFGGQTTGRLGASYALSDSLTLRASAATGYRAPSGYELYDPWAGNTALTPETSQSYDLGLEKAWGETKLSATLFTIQTDNLIDYVAGAYTQVAGTTTRQGVELGLEGKLSGRFGYALNYTYLDWENPTLSTSSSWNTSFGRHTLNATLDAELTDRLSGAVSLRHVAKRQSLPDYTVVDAKVSYDLGQDREAWLRVENLFDEDYQHWPGYGTSKRAVYVGLSAKF